MRSKIVAGLGIAVLAAAQTPSRKVDFPAESPLSLKSVDWGGSDSTTRGGAMFLDVHASLSLVNNSQRHVRSVTLAVVSQEVAPGGKGSVSVPSLDIGPGAVFPVAIDLRLLRPVGARNSGPEVEVRLDGVLFDDLSFFGPDQLHSRRSMTVWELEARRDRTYFKKVLEQAGRDTLQKEMQDSLARQTDRQQPGVQMVRGRATNADPERELSFAFLEVPDAPIKPTTGMARIAGNEAHGPRMEVLNRSERPIRYLEMGWVVKDGTGREFLAASMPADVNLAPGRSGQVIPDFGLRLPERTSIQSMTGFVSTVEFADGSYWIPSRTTLNDAKLRRIAAPSPEEQRLTQIYLKKGLVGLVDELKKF
jgi:hypothetical protein